MKTLIILVAVLWTMLTMAEPALAQGCTTQTYMINGKILICTVCPGMTTCN